ncbi:hypothetical protein EFO61_10950 [Lacticaseibacillus rhamnosus]|nr:Hypothetical protein LOCK900_1467 [Lacticaseibacillus rhamnosus LOCK900]EHJ24141.1 hypothetical protein R0011_02890 [Lacticaseibacillus rhamnosus R0011]MCT3144497.1 hypothetical protein [Lacticaseibacillus rhamnosus]MCT3152551.1 hypothetical protein [Lacticaseibacillus rhamnosus]MCT3162467.1 hypothetical protein [Lacticaseibacillus rhamnosus]
MALIPNGRALAIWNQGPYVQVSGPVSAFTSSIGQYHFTNQKVAELTTPLAIWNQGSYVQVSGPVSAFTKGIGQHHFTNQKVAELTTLLVIWV